MGSAENSLKRSYTMGQAQPGGGGQQPPGGKKGKEEKKGEKKWQPPKPTRVGKKNRKKKGPQQAFKLPSVKPLSKCKLRLMRLERVKDYLLLEEEFLSNQEALKPREEKDQEEKNKVEELRGTPMGVGTLEEIIDDNHAIVSSAMGPEYYVGMMSF